MPSSGTPSIRLTRLFVGAIVCGTVATACTSAPDESMTPAEYRTAVEAVCTGTSSARDQLTEPADVAAVAAFADSVAKLLTDEADSIRVIRPPDELDDDHRALVQNTADQASRWTTLASTPPTDTETFGSLTDEIAALSFGRDDLAAQMQLIACQRTS
jgi:hypothetical protein